jgi:hypothetical protein
MAGPARTVLRSLRQALSLFLYTEISTSMVTAPIAYFLTAWKAEAIAKGGDDVCFASPNFRLRVLTQTLKYYRNLKTEEAY